MPEDKDITEKSEIHELPLMLSVTVMLFLYAVVFMMYWRWFVVPLGVRNISFLHAVGFMFFINFFRIREAKALSRNKEGRINTGRTVSWVRYLLDGCTHVVFTLFVGWVIQWAMHRFHL